MTDQPPRISPARALVIYVLVVFIGGALIAPWVHHLVVALAPHSEFAANLSERSFRAVVNRSVYLIALIGMWPLIRSLRIGSWREIGWWRKPGWAGNVGKGVAFGTVLLLLAAGAALLSGAAVVDPAAPIAKKLPGIVFASVFVALLEETFFRGAIFFVLQRAFDTVKALWLTSAIYAIFHFFARAESPKVIEWHSGFVVLAKMLAGFVDPALVIPGFLSLTLLGLIFNLFYLRTGALYLSIGMHAALIFWSKLYAVALNKNAVASQWFWGSEKLTDGWFCFLLLLAATLFAWKRKA